MKIFKFYFNEKIFYVFEKQHIKQELALIFWF